MLSVVCWLAIVPAVMPASWIEHAHESMGLGQFPQSPIAFYMARCLSAVSVFIGGLFWLLARDVVRYRIVIQYGAVSLLLLSMASVTIGLHAQLPFSWLLVDTLGCSVFCLPTLWLVNRIP